MRKRSSALRLKLNHITIEVRALSSRREFDEGSYGWFIPREQAIYIDADQPASEQARILCHEIIHALWWAHNLPKETMDEERICGALESPFAALFRDNPHLAAAMAAAFAGKPLV